MILAKQYSSSAIDAADSVYEYLKRYAPIELQSHYKLFYDDFVDWNIKRESAVQNAEQIGKNLLTKYFKQKEAL